MPERPKRIPSVAVCRAAQGRAPNGMPIDPAARFARTPLNSKTAELEEIERLARHLLTLPAEDRAAAALRAFPPSNLREALWHYARGASPAESCRKSGANPAAFDLYLRSEPASHDLRQVMRGVLEIEYAPAAFAFLYRTMLDEAAPMRCRTDSAKILVDRAGYVAGAPAADAAFDKEIEEMSITELTNLVGDLKSKRAAAAIDVTPPGEGLVEDEDDGAPPPADDAPPH
jgi:hypothetical protein